MPVAKSILHDADIRDDLCIYLEEKYGRVRFFDELKLTNQMSLLWRREMAELQKANGLYKYPGKSKMFVKKYLMESLDSDILKEQMLKVLFERDYSIFDEGKE